MVGRLGAMTFIPRIIRKLDASIQSSVRGFWQFDGDLTDDSGNGLTLTANAGTVRFATIDGLQTFFPADGQFLQRVVHDADLTLLGVVTINLLAYLVGQSAGSRKYVDFAGPGETEADNTLYMWRDLSPSHRMQATWEFGGGANVIVELETPPAVGAFHLHTLTRAANGTDLTLYIDGVAVGTFSGSDAPTGGSTATLQRVAVASGYYAGIMISAEEASAATVLAQARNVGVSI